jgi:hypothetical protein
MSSTSEAEANERANHLVELVQAALNDGEDIAETTVYTY